MNKEIFDQYISRMSDIRTLSSPVLKKEDDASEYSRRLRENFRRIGILAAENRRVLDEYIFPLAESNEPLTDEEIEEIREFNDRLVDDMTVENLDGAIRSLLADRLLRDAERKGDEAYLLQEYHDQIVVCHTFMYMTSRIHTNPSISRHFRERGLEISKRVMEYLDHDKFERLDNTSRDTVLMITRFHTTLWGSASGITVDEAHKWMDGLKKAIEVFEDPFYHEVFPEYNWDYYLFRTLEYYSSILDYIYDEKLPDEDIAFITEQVKRQDAMWHDNPEVYDGYTMHPMILLSYHQVRFLSGEIDENEYRDELLSLYNNRKREAYDFDNLFVNIRSALDTIISWRDNYIPERDKAMIDRFYHGLCEYVLHMPNGGTLSELLELYTPILMHFKEIPGKITFEEMGLRSLAAFHPPTYVHSVMVAQLSLCLCSHLLEKSPELFIGMLGCVSVRDVSDRKNKIKDFIYHAALCHDFGKLAIIDTVFIYGRRLLDFEFDIIKQHPEIGADMMSRHESTRLYADIALGHHRWYDNTRGYPEDFNTADSPYKTLIDIVACADCMDAATDSIGRSYNQGKTLADYEKEVIEGTGTRYAPYLPELIADEAVRADLDYLLTEGRNNNYRNTYLLLSEVQQLAE